MKQGLAIKELKDRFQGIVYSQAADGSTWVKDIISADTIDNLCLYFVFEYESEKLDYVYDYKQSKMIDPESLTVWEAAESLFNSQKEIA